MIHSCLFYRTRHERDAAAAAFFKDGLARGDRCVMAAGSVEDTADGLQDKGLDVDRLRRHGDLVLIDARAVYLPTGRFSSEGSLELWARHLEEALSEGRPGLCVVGDLTGIIDRSQAGDSVVSYEFEVNQHAALPISALCCYQRGRREDRALRDILRAHPLAQLGPAQRKNPFFLHADGSGGRPALPRLEEMLSLLGG